MASHDITWRDKIYGCLCFHFYILVSVIIATLLLFTHYFQDVEVASLGLSVAHAWLQTED